jgi:hypothetical protein
MFVIIIKHNKIENDGFEDEEDEFEDWLRWWKYIFFYFNKSLLKK